MKRKLKATPLMMLLFKDIDLLEHDAVTQYKFNRFWVIVWACSMVSIPFDPTLYGHSTSALIIQEVSLWANLATHFGAMSSALAAKNTTHVVQDASAVVASIDENVDSIGEVLGVE